MFLTNFNLRNATSLGCKTSDGLHLGEGGYSSYLRLDIFKAQIYLDQLKAVNGGMQYALQ
jgi:hypothetical protein